MARFRLRRDFVCHFVSYTSPYVPDLGFHVRRFAWSSALLAEAVLCLEAGCGCRLHHGDLHTSLDRGDAVIANCLYNPVGVAFDGAA
jgi:hypothetical protein